MKIESGKIETGASRNFPPDSDGNTSSKAREYSTTNSVWFSKRMLVAFVVFLGFTNGIMVINNVNIAVVEMTSEKIVTIGPNTTVIRPAEFQWDTITISTVASIYWYGGLFAFLGAYFADKFGGSVSCAACMTVAGILTILQPAILHLDYYLFLVCGFLAGLFTNSFFVCNAEVYSRWFPKNERSILTAICYNGVNAGIALSFFAFGYIAGEFSWQMVFYVSGSISIFLGLLCLIVVKNRPSEDPCISEEELSYILHGVGDVSRNTEPHPYREIFLSRPVLALCVGKITLLWLITVLSGSLPLYIKDLTDKSTQEIGILSAIPTALQIITFPLAGALLHAWDNTRTIELTLMHKIALGSAFMASSIILLTAVFLNDFTTTMICIVLIQILISAVPPVLEPIIVNISPNDCTIIAGLVKFASSIGIIVSRTCVGYMTVYHSSQEWNNCFLMTAGVLILGAILFTIFSSSEAQPWSSFSISQQERRPLVKIKYRRKSSS